MFNPGDVVRFRSAEAGKPKYHLCISLNGKYLFINSPKEGRSYPTDFTFPCSEMRFIPATTSGFSIISCSLIMEMNNRQLRNLRASKEGSISTELLIELIAFIEHSPVLAEEEIDALIEGLGDWV